MKNTRIGDRPVDARLGTAIGVANLVQHTFVHNMGKNPDIAKLPGGVRNADRAEVALVSQALAAGSGGVPLVRVWTPTIENKRETVFLTVKVVAPGTGSEYTEIRVFLLGTERIGGKDKPAAKSVSTSYVVDGKWTPQAPRLRQ